MVDMTTPRELTRAVAAAIAMPLPTAVASDRALALRGYRTLGGRGPSAARMTPRDATNLVLGLCGAFVTLTPTPLTADAYERFAGLYNLESPAYSEQALPLLRGLPEEHSFREAIEALIVAAGNDSLRSWLVQTSSRARTGGADILLVDIHGPEPRAKITIRTDANEIKVHYKPLHSNAEEFGIPELVNDDVALDQPEIISHARRIYRLNEQTLFAIANSLNGGGVRR